MNCFGKTGTIRIECNKRPKGRMKKNGTFVNPAPYLGLPENIVDGTDVSAIIKGD